MAMVGLGKGITCVSRVYPGRSGKDRGDRGRVNVHVVGAEGDGLCWEGGGGRGVWGYE